MNATQILKHFFIIYAYFYREFIPGLISKKGKWFRKKDKLQRVDSMSVFH